MVRLFNKPSRPIWRAKKARQKLYRESRDVCFEAKDYVTMKPFKELLVDEEGHIDFLETQIELFNKLGETAYIQLNASTYYEAE